MGIIRRHFIGAMLVTFLTVGCNAASSNQPVMQASLAPVSPAEQTARTEAIAQKDAQQVWCEYLDALHRRAGESPGALPSFQQCLEARTYASPKMLRHTARCSRSALDKVDGDPFTNEYAVEVARCGSDALDVCEVQSAELQPYVTAICSCMDRCGDVNYSQCENGLGGGLGPHLARAVGAMNERGRDAFQGCLKKLSCEEVGSQIVKCLDPIMDRLLWLPE